MARVYLVVGGMRCLARSIKKLIKKIILVRIKQESIVQDWKLILDLRHPRHHCLSGADP